MKIAIIGAGLTGGVLSYYMTTPGHRVDVFDTRPHLGGNCYTARDSQTNILEHVYGPHIFNTSNKKIWDFVRQFGEFAHYTNRVKANTGGKVYSMPINLHTLNQVWNTNLSPREAQIRLAEITANYADVIPTNFEEQALKLVGDELYEKFFLHYTTKQWGVSPRELPASILKRLPIRFTYDDNYYSTTYQGMPINGYTQIIKNMLVGANVFLNTNYDKSCDGDYDHVFYTGSIDSYFAYSLGRLSYRTVEFEKFYSTGAYQGVAVMNYCDTTKPYTRVHEHKFFAPWEKHKRSLVVVETSKKTTNADTPFYPMRLESDCKLYKEYSELAKQLPNVTFAGRLGEYRYYNMDQAILAAQNIANNFLNHF